MIFFWVLLVALGVEGSKEIFFETKPSPFKDLLADLLENCHEPETVFFYGDVQNEVVQAAVDSNRKIQRLNSEDQGITVNSKDLLVIFLDQLHRWSRRLAGAFSGINTVFVVIEQLQFDQVKVIFADLWNASESANVFVCSETEDGKSLQVVTFNPYCSYAPKGFWSRWKDQKIFFGRYSPDKRIDPCSILLFDRTKHLDDYPIQVLQFVVDTWIKSMSGHFLITRASPSPVLIFPYSRFILSSLIDSLSVSVNLTNLLFTERNLSSFLINSSLTKSLDLKIKPWFTSNTSLLSYYDPSYPFLFQRDIIVTHRRGLMTPLEKMFNFYGWLTIAATVIIISVAFLVIYLSSNLLLSFSIFDSLRLIINVAIASKMESTKSRIFFSVIFLYFLVIQATFSGHLAAFLTKPEYRENVESLEDLKDSRYQVIYAHPAAKGYIKDELLVAKTLFGKYLCNTDTIVNPSAACIDSYRAIRYLIAEFDLHQAKNPLVTKFSSFLLRKNWRLKDRVNLLIARIVDSGLNFKKSNFSGWKIKRYFRQLEERLGPNYYRPVEFQDLLFIFLLLSAGLLVASLAFLAELGVQGWKDHQRGIKKQWRAFKRAAKVAHSMVLFKIKRWVRRPRKNRRSKP